MMDTKRPLKGKARDETGRKLFGRSTSAASAALPLRELHSVVQITICTKILHNLPGLALMSCKKMFELYHCVNF
jgi:hypothetical protein